VTAPPGRGTGAGQQPAADGWRASLPELAIAIALVAVVCGAVYLFAGAGTAAAALVGCAVALLIALRATIPARSALPRQQQPWRANVPGSFTRFWRKRGMLTDATRSMASYDAELRPTLEHLLAARLAERHNLSLYQDPAAARRLLLPGSHQDALWFWLDPARPAETQHNRPGIPTGTLAAIIDRLERL
jgi:hypothetical protein